PGEHEEKVIPPQDRVVAFENVLVVRVEPSTRSLVQLVRRGHEAPALAHLPKALGMWQLRRAVDQWRLVGELALHIPGKLPAEDLRSGVAADRCGDRVRPGG